MSPADTGELRTALRRSADSSEVPAPVAAPFVSEHLGTLRVAKSLGRQHPDRSIKFAMFTVNDYARRYVREREAAAASE
jgi:predicted LPLAT superfamily acyltransferase